MVSIPSEVIFRFSELNSTVVDPGESWQLLLRINAVFQILINEKIVYHEVEFPVLEFAATAYAWLHNHQKHFLFTSMESAEEPLLVFERLESDEFILQALGQYFGPFSGVALRINLEMFYHELILAIERSFQIDVRRLFENM